ncbi:MAG: hypothetical protein WAV47_21205, partial [Blastocatellia bacterium]
VRNTAGQLRVRVRNANPPVESNEVTAGALVGPEITSIKVKRKRSGLLILKIRGARFEPGMTVTVTREDGQAVPISSTSFSSAEQIQVKIAASVAPPRSSVVRVRAASTSGVQTNELVITLSK